MHGRWTETQAMTLCQLFYNLFLESGYVGQAYLLSRVLRFGIPGVCHYTTTPRFSQDLHVIPLNLAAESSGLKKLIQLERTHRITVFKSQLATSWHASQTAGTRLPLGRVQTSAGAHRGDAFLL